MRIITTTAFAYMALTLSACATPVITKNYSYFAGDFAYKDASCISAFREHIVPDYEGIEEISLTHHAIFETRNGSIASYPGAKFKSRFGDSTGTINCIFATDGQTITDVMIAFEAPGLAGHKKHILAKTMQKLSEQGTAAVSKTTQQ